jgi:multicomponent Na+:H+ antiporter subunit E
VLILPLLFFAFWVILNSRITLEVIVLGVFLSALMSLFVYRVLGFDFKKELRGWAQTHRIALYMLVLLSEIIKANFLMLRIILSPKINSHIHPQIVYFQSPFKSDSAKILFIYSIMLTPGTILFDLDGERFGGHSINAATAHSFDSWNLIRRLRELEGGH